MKAESEELLSRLVDGEVVDPNDLAVALAEPGASDVLVQYARVHRAVLDDRERPSDAFYQVMRAKLQPRRVKFAAWRAPLAAAAVVILSVLGGVWIGWSVTPARVVSVPVAVRVPGIPVPAQETRPLPPVSVPPAAQPLHVGCPPERPPEAVRVIEFRPGVDWQTGARRSGERP